MKLIQNIHSYTDFEEFNRKWSRSENCFIGFFFMYFTKLLDFLVIVIYSQCNNEQHLEKDVNAVSILTD